jgi:hypothetical protein
VERELIITDVDGSTGQYTVRTPSPSHSPSFRVVHERAGSVALVIPLTDPARSYLDEVLQYVDHTRFGDGVAVEHRFLPGFVGTLVTDGWPVAVLCSVPS